MTLSLTGHTHGVAPSWSGHADLRTADDSGPHEQQTEYIARARAEELGCRVLSLDVSGGGSEVWHVTGAGDGIEDGAGRTVQRPASPSRKTD
jgi:hypothetical protein